jgi:large repetitive protein
MLIRRLARLFSTGNASPRPARLATFEALEDRILLAAQPVVALDVPATALIGGDVQATATFSNIPDGTPGSANGFGPVLDLILPHNGADGDGVGSTPPFQNDGITLNTASYLGINLAIAQVEFDAAGNAAHPYLRDAAGQPLIVTGTPGDMLAAIQLPFGSVTPGQTPIAVQLGLQVSNLADADTPLPITARGAFQFGRDAESNPGTDPPVLGSFTPPANVTPTVMQLSKSFSGPEGETVTGPNSPRSYTITLSVAPGQTISDVTIQDQFADGIVVRQAGIVAPGGVVAFDAGTNRLTVDYAGPITGGVSITVPFHVGQLLAPNAPADPVLPPVSGAARAMGNDVLATASWTPLDPRDPATTITLDPPGFENVFTAKSLAVQKSVALQNDVLGNGIGPDDTLQYTLRGQVSDYFSFDNLLLTDLLSDGQRLDLGFAPVITLHEGATDLTAGINPGSFSLSRSPTTGVSTLAFNLSQWLLDNGGDALLNGDATGTLGVTSFTITYRAVIERSYLAPPQGPVAQNDSLGNQVSVAGRVDLDGVPGGLTGGEVTDTSQSGVTVTAGASSKSVYALNGQLVAGPVTIVSGDTVTFRLTRSFPQGTVNDFSLTDFLPLPIFNVGQQSFTFADVVSAAAPADGVVQWGPSAAAFRALYGAVPNLATSLANNALTFDFGDIGDGTPVSTTLDLLFTVRVLDRPLGDQLLLTNLATAQETNSAGGIITDNDIAQVTLSEPVLQVHKGVVATSDAGASFSPGAVGPVAFTAPGSAGVRFSGVINSTNLLATPIDSDLRGVDAGDLVTFAVIVENTGTGRNGAFDIQFRDLLPARFGIPAGGLNLQVTDGAGNPLAYTLDTSSAALGLSFTLDDAPGAGALAARDPTSGRNIMVVTFDAILGERVEPRSQLTNTASVLGFAALEGGLNRAPNAPPGTLTDTADVEVEAVRITKAVVATSLAETGSGRGNPNLPDLAIGETVTFDITVTLPEGQVIDLVLQDLLPISTGKLKLLEASVVSIGDNLRDGLVTLLALPTGIITDRNNDGIADTVTWTAPGSVLNLADNVSDQKDQIVLRVVAAVPDVAVNTAGDRLTNTAKATYSVGSVGTVTEQATAAVELVEPKFHLAKTVSPGSAVANDLVTYTVTFQAGPDQSFAGPAFDVVLEDALIPGKVSLENLVSVTSTAAFTQLAGPGLRLSFPVLLPTDTVTIIYTGRLDGLILAGEQLVNTVTTSGLSAPNPPPTGTDQRPFSLTDSAIVQVPGDAITKVVSATSLPETGSGIYNGSIPDLAIGETVDFTITLTLARALSQSLTLVDVLPNNSGVSASSGVLTAFDAQVLSIGSALSGATPNITLTGSQVTITFGDVLNSATGPAVGADEQITVLIRATLVNDPGNVARDILTNQATVSTDTGSGTFSRSATARVEVVEPSLTIDKSGNVIAGDAGDVVTYTVTIPRGPSSGPAFDLRIEDALPADLRGIAGSGSIVAGPAGAAISYDGAANRFIVTAASYLTTDPLLTFTYQARIAPAAFPGEVIVNTATLTWDSFPGTPPSLPQGDQRLYGPVSASHEVTIPGVRLSKEVSGTDSSGTGVAEFDPLITDMVIGERVQFTLTLRLPEGTTSLVLTDFLPVPTGSAAQSGRLAYESSRVAEIGANISGSLLAVGAAGIHDAASNSVTFDFGTVVNQPDNTGDSRDRITVTLIARLVDVPENQVGDLLTNTARVDFTGGTASDTAQVEVVGPALQLTKTADKAVADAGDIITYTLTITTAPGATAAAALLNITDLLGPGLALVTGSVTTTQTSLGAGTITAGNGLGDTGIGVSFVTLARTEAPQIITYQARVTDAAVAGSTIPNTANLAYSSWVVQGRPAPGLSASADFTLPVPSLAKAVAATGLSETGSNQFDPSLPDLSLGETVTYRLTASLIEGTQGLRIADLLPAGLTPLSASVVGFGNTGMTNTAGLVVGSAGVIAGQGVSFDFGTVVNPGDNIATNDTVVVEVVARATDLAGLLAGTVLTNAARLDHGAGFGAAVTAPVEIVLPDLRLTKSVAAPASGDAGDLMTYTVTVAHSGSSTGPAYDLALTDLLAGAKLLYVPNSATAMLGGAPVGSFDATGGDLRFTLGTLGLTAGTLTVTYQARLADTVEDGGLVVNSVALAYDTAPGVVTGERVFTPPPETASVTVIMPATLDKSITATSLAATPNGQVAPGETITYSLVTTISEGTQKLVLADLLPAHLEVLSASVAGFGNPGMTNTAGLVVGSAGVIAGQGVSFDFGTVVNPGDNITTNNSVTVQILARVRDTAPAGAVLTNAATATVTDTTGGHVQNLADDVSVTVVTPILTFDKALESYIPGDAGTEAVFALTLSHAAGSTGPAFGSITDILPSGLRDAVILSVTGPAGPGSVTGSTITIPLAAAGFLPGDPGIVVRFAARLADSVEHQVTVTNEASATYRPSPGGGIPVTLTDDASLLPLFTPGFTKTLSATDNPDTAGNAVAIGEVVTYRLRAMLAEGTQRLLLTDALPAGMRLMDATIRYDSAAISAPAFADGAVVALTGTSLSLDFGTVVNRGDNLAGNDALDVFVRARVVDTPGVDAGRTLLNSAILTPGTTAGLPIGAPIPGATPVQVVEPVLILSKSVEGFARPGETAPYTLVLGHAGHSTAAAYDVTLADLLATAGLSLVPGSASVSDNAGGATGASVTSNAGTLGVFVPRLALGEMVTIRFDAAIAASVAPTSSLPNTANVQWTSSPGATPGERAYAGEASALLPLAPVLTKAIIATSVAETGTAQFNPGLPDLAIGETVTFRISLLLPQAVLGGVILTDLLPEGLLPLAAQVESVGTAISGITAGSAGAIAGQAVSFGFGTVVNAGSAAIGAEDRVTLLVTARATEANAAGRILTNTAQLDFTLRGEAGTERASASAEIVTPLLTIAKTVTPDFQSPGQAVTHGLTINHLAASTQDAFDVTLSDLALGSSVERGSVVVTGAAQPVTVAYVGTGFTVSLARLALGETLGLTYRAILDLVPPITGEVVNTALVQGDSLPEGAGIPQFRTGASDQARVLVASGMPPEAVPEGGLLSSYRGISPNLTTGIRPDIGFAGAAAPGTLLVISLRDSLGRIVTSVDALADLGGNWLAGIPSLAPPGSQLPNTGDYLGATRLFTNLVGGFGSGVAPLNPVTPFGDLSTSPYTVEVTIRRGLGENFGETAMNSRIYFQDLTTGGAFVSDGGLTIRDIFANTPSQSIRNAVAGLVEPYSFSINKFAAEFLSAGAIPGVANR